MEKYKIEIVKSAEKSLAKIPKQNLIKIVTAINEYLAFRQVADEVATPAVLVEHLAVDGLWMRPQVEITSASRKRDEADHPKPPTH